MYDSNKPIIKKYDEALNKADIKNYGLSIQLGPDGFSFCILDLENRKFLGCELVSFGKKTSPENYISKVFQYFTGHDWIVSDYRTKLIFFETGLTTLIPTPLFSAREKEVIADFNFGLQAGQIVLYDKIENLDAYILYAVPEGLFEKLTDFFPGLIFRNHLGALAEILLVLTKNLPEMKRLYVNVRASQLDIIILEGKNLLFCNSNSYQSKEDFIYFIIFVLEQLNINPGEIELFFSGTIDKQSEIFDITQKYIRHVDFQKLPDNYNYSYIFNEIPGHYFFGLLNAPLCGL